jgi:hypothetical protein
MIVAYIVYKVFNLLNKLKQTKKREAKFEANLKYINSMQGSQVQGEGVKDLYLGILFKKNTAYRP